MKVPLYINLQEVYLIGWANAQGLLYYLMMRGKAYQVQEAILKSTLFGTLPSS